MLTETFVLYGSNKQFSQPYSELDNSYWYIYLGCRNKKRNDYVTPETSIFVIARVWETETNSLGLVLDYVLM